MKVTLDGIKAKIKNETYLVLPDGRSTLCMLTLENGYTIKGMSACVDSAEFDLNMGRKIAFDDAINQIWPLEGYLLAQRIFEGDMPVTMSEVVAEAQKVFGEEFSKMKLSQPRVEVMKKAGVWKNKTTRNKIIAKYEEYEAPWGRKKDGTPKKRPGRQPRKASK